MKSRVLFTRKGSENGCLLTLRSNSIEPFPFSKYEVLYHFMNSRASRSSLYILFYYKSIIARKGRAIQIYVLYFANHIKI